MHVATTGTNIFLEILAEFFNYQSFLLAKISEQKYYSSVAISSSSLPRKNKTGIDFLKTRRTYDEKHNTPIENIYSSSILSRPTF